MKKTKKLEDMMNNLYLKIKQLPLSQEDIDDINLKGFLYSVGRLNVLQVTAFLVRIALDYKMPTKEIYDSLEEI